MQWSLRAKLVATLGVLLLGFLVVIVSGALLGKREEHQLALIREHYIPQLALAPRLQRQFESLTRGLQDAVAAQDAEALDKTREQKDKLLNELAAGQHLLQSGRAASLEAAIDDYYASAYELSRRLLAGEPGEAVVDAVTDMQQKLRRAETSLTRTTALDHQALSQAFAEVSSAQATASRLRLVIGVGCLLLVLLLSAAMGRGFLRTLSELSAGFDRFGRGEFSARIPELGADEMGQLSRQANEMAERLSRAASERERADWLKAGRAGLAHVLQGELSPEEVATRAARHLARHLEAATAALYRLEADGSLALLGHYAAPTLQPSAEVVQRLAMGQGLTGQAALEQTLTVLENLPPDYLHVRSGLGGCRALALALLPLEHLGRTFGVLELASLKPWTRESSEMLMSVRETLTIALEAAGARAALTQLLKQTQAQAERLRMKEEELQGANRELQQANSELTERGSRLEEQRKTLEASNRQLAQMRVGLEQQAHELQRVSAYKSQFLANMSHELRTPLNSMLLLSRHLAENGDANLTEKQVEFCETIHQSGRDLLALINQVLDLAKIEAGKQELTLSTVSLAELALYARRTFEPQARDKQLALHIELDSALPNVLVADQRRLEQIVNNLLGNAIKFTSRGKVWLTLRSVHDRDLVIRPDLARERIWVLEVGDTGIGIPDRERERIFAPFEQIENASDRRYGGTGLGLTIARELVELMGGELTLHSVEGEGSTFVCYLPLHRPTGENINSLVHGSTSRPPPAAAASSARCDLSGKLCIIVDDDMRTLYALSSFLRSSGADVLTADNAPDAQALVAEHADVRFALLDTGLLQEAQRPGLSALWASLRERNIVVIELASENAAQVQQPKPIDVAARLSKPIDPLQVGRLLEQHVSSAEVRA